MEPTVLGFAPRRAEDALDARLNGAEVGGVPTPNDRGVRLNQWLLLSSRENCGYAARPVWTALEA